MERTVIDTLLVTLVCVATYTDVRRGKVYNVLTFPGIALGLALNAIFWGPDGLLESVRAGVLAFFLLVVPVALRGMGAGDLKLLVAVGALEGVGFLLAAFFWATLVAGVVGVMVLCSRRLAFAGPMWFANLAVIRLKTIPYAVPLAAGCLIALTGR